MGRVSVLTLFLLGLYTQLLQHNMSRKTILHLVIICLFIEYEIVSDNCYYIQQNEANLGRIVSRTRSLNVVAKGMRSRFVCGNLIIRSPMATLFIISVSVFLFSRQIMCPKPSIKKLKIYFCNIGSHLEFVFEKTEYFQFEG